MRRKKGESTLLAKYTPKYWFPPGAPGGDGPRRRLRVNRLPNLFTTLFFFCRRSPIFGKNSSKTTVIFQSFPLCSRRGETVLVFFSFFFLLAGRSTDVRSLSFRELVYFINSFKVRVLLYSTWLIIRRLFLDLSISHLATSGISCCHKFNDWWVGRFWVSVIMNAASSASSAFLRLRLPAAFAATLHHICLLWTRPMCFGRSGRFVSLLGG